MGGAVEAFAARAAAALAGYCYGHNGTGYGGIGRRLRNRPLLQHRMEAWWRRSRAVLQPRRGRLQRRSAGVRRACWSPVVSSLGLCRSNSR